LDVFRGFADFADADAHCLTGFSGNGFNRIAQA